MAPAWEVTMEDAAGECSPFLFESFFHAQRKLSFPAFRFQKEEIWKQEKYQEHVLNPRFTVLPWWNPLDANSLTSLWKSICAPYSSVPAPTGHCLSWPPDRLISQKGTKDPFNLQSCHHLCALGTYLCTCLLCWTEPRRRVVPGAE